MLLQHSEATLNIKNYDLPAVFQKPYHIETGTNSDSLCFFIGSLLHVTVIAPFPSHFNPLASNFCKILCKCTILWMHSSMCLHMSLCVCEHVCMLYKPCLNQVKWKLHINSLLNKQTDDYVLLRTQVKYRIKWTGLSTC